jgi:phospholipase/lecithinase/hemolysin
MQRLWTLVAAGIALTFGAQHSATGSELPPVKEAVFFGDSLTDAGTFGVRFTTASGFVWAQLMAKSYGQSTQPNEHLDSFGDAFKGNHGKRGPGGLNYAEGGARVALPFSNSSDDPEGTPISAAVQLQHFLTQYGAFKPSQIVLLYIGTNDVGYDYDPQNNPTLARQLREDVFPDHAIFQAQQARVEAAADATIGIVAKILNSGAKRLVLFELPDMGELPWFQTRASQVFATRLARAFNRRLSAGLPTNPAILVIKMQDFVNELLRHSRTNGIKHGAHEDACRVPEQDFCDLTSLAVPDANQTYIFAAAEHLTTHANELLATYVMRQISQSSLR